ncbi:uncharacterized protein UHOD_12368 [Ustilago sp. UG-2017b]|nr:uncharacterized protein UHOD_12368 [Ustilago sp. UG-2017b]
MLKKQEGHVMGLNAQEAGRPLVHMEGAQVSGDQTDQRGEAVDLAGTGREEHRYQGLEEDHHSRLGMVEQEARGLAGTGSRNGRSATSMESAASMETMDMEDRAVCMVIQAPPQGGPSSRSIQMVPT